MGPWLQQVLILKNVVEGAESGRHVMGAHLLPLKPKASPTLHLPKSKINYKANLDGIKECLGVLHRIFLAI